MNRETTRIARKRADRTVIVRNVATAHKRYFEKMLFDHAEDLSDAIVLTDPDGVQQYVHGVTPLDGNVRVGNKN